ncbi:AsnC family transcriptional regulator [Actinoplanes sp. TRM 88003]|uniref:AsnC family transcriptional regulator n=1 Tax=Paractinoplanes aksuensis TaxID=2939490 RepID=A0ABT1E4D1_9ACTN|nr:AsnC family transcriptional regulator [Actinoplanes aksuensis]MCO8277958.1 AsnC family transcriptional regulator [Actinoplanes aksuensis]
MPALTPAGPAVIDRLDRQIIHGLQLTPRVPFARLATVLGVSEQTVSRRYQRMRTHGLIRVFGIADPVSTTSSWILRIACRPGTAAATAAALARRTDTSWVSIGAGGAELTCQVTVDEGSPEGREGLLHHLPRASNVLSLSSHQVLHRFIGRGEADWITAHDQLGSDQRRELLADQPAVAAPAGPAELTPDDRPLLVALAHDGRASYAALAEATGWTQRKVTLRLQTLAGAGLVRFDLDTATAALGFREVAYLWFTVAPTDLATVGARLADHRRLAWASAVTGAASLVAIALCPDATALYHYLTTDVAAIREVRTCETVPLVTRVKLAVSLLENGVLRGPVV